MVKLDNVTEGVLDVINDNKFSQTGAFNLRENGIRYDGMKHKNIIGPTKRKKVRIVDFGDTLTEIQEI